MEIFETILVSAMIDIIVYLVIEFLKSRKEDKEDKFNRQVDERIEKYFETEKKSRPDKKSSSKAKK